MDGVLLLDKPAGISSMQAVARVKRALGIRKAGHTGTLDPIATGVLAICLGQGTRVAGLMLASVKGYRAEMTLGVATDTLDCEGQILSEQPIPTQLEREPTLIAEALAHFQGPQMQTPPAFSALKVNGKRAYALAREGKEVKLEPRPVEILSIELNDVSLPKVTFTCDVSKGTYIRSLIRDLGERLGCGAHMSALRRLSVGHFGIDSTLTLEQVETRPEEAIAAILPLVDALDEYPVLSASAIECARLHNGLIAHTLQEIPPSANCLHRVLREDGTLLALLEPSEKPDQHWKVHKVFNS